MVCSSIYVSDLFYVLTCRLLDLPVCKSGSNALSRKSCQPRALLPSPSTKSILQSSSNLPLRTPALRRPPLELPDYLLAPRCATMHTSKSGDEEEVDGPSVENGVPHGRIYDPTVYSSSYMSDLFHILTSNLLDLYIWNARS